jgi:hypothetical protein
MSAVTGFIEDPLADDLEIVTGVLAGVLIIVYAFAQLREHASVDDSIDPSTPLLERIRHFLRRRPGVPVYVLPTLCVERSMT